MEITKYNLSDAPSLIKEKRERLQMNQKEFANFIGLSKYGDRTIRRWENGESMPSILELNAIMRFHERIPFEDNMKAKYKMIDLFSGIGGIRLGFQKTGKTKTIFASEIDKFAIQTYKANFGDKPDGDITKLDENNIPDHDILTAGFPCQAFSQAGLKLGFEDTRGTLFFDVARIIQAKRPKAFLLENVKNLKSHDKGRTFKVIENTLRELDYSIFSKVLKARDFGVPQNRERIYIVGFDNKQIKNSHHFYFPNPTIKKTRVGDILEHNVDEKYTISDKLWEGHQRRKKEHKKKGNGFGYTLFNAESKYTNTISARYYKDGSEILIDQGKYKNPRKLTPREACRLQGFPDDFCIPVSDTQAYKQFGNSVAVPVIHEIAKNIIKVLDENKTFEDSL